MISKEQIEQRHPEFREFREAWELMGLLYEGGCRLQNSAAKLLKMRPKEVAAIYQTRLERLTYQPILGPIIDWYAASLFKTPPEIDVTEDGDMPKEVQAFLSHCQRLGARPRKSFVDFVRDVMSKALLYGKAYVLIDKPRQAPANRAEEKAQRPYLLAYDPNQITDWATNEDGELDWILIHTESQERAFNQKPMRVESWWYFDRQNYELSQRRSHLDDFQRTGAIEQVASGPHALSMINKVPVHSVSVPMGMWLGNKCYLQARDHLNSDNALAWGIFMGCLAMPVVYSDSDVDMTLAESGYIQLKKDDRFEWAEPGGISFGHMRDRRNDIREDAYRSAYLVQQGRSSEATPAAQSGYSKELDMAPSSDVLAIYGDVAREAMLALLSDVAAAAGYQDMTFDVRGFRFEESGADAELDTFEKLKMAQIPSDTLYREAEKRVALSYLGDVTAQGVIDAVTDEIDKAKTITQRAEAEHAKRVEEVSKGLGVIE